MLSKALQAAAGNAGAGAYVEDVFSTYLYTGNGSTQTITNGIDLAGEGGLVWIKHRTLSASHVLTDSAVGLDYWLRSNSSIEALSFSGNGLTAPVFNADGFTTSNYSDGGQQSGYPFASWTFRKAEKFFDIVTGTQTVAGNVTLNHNLGSIPGVIIVKSLSSANNWNVYHRSLGTSQYLTLETTDAASSAYAAWGGVAPTATQFTIGYQYPVGTTFVAYLFAHDAGGFGDDGTENVISCGSFTTDGGGNATVTLGWEPQFLIFKPSTGAGNWQMVDNMRSWTANGSGTARLFPNNSGTEVTTSVISGVNATGFTQFNGSVSTTYIYIAIRRGPMKTPESGTEVFSPVARTGTGSVTSVTAPNFPVDMVMIDDRLGYRTMFFDKLRGANQYITSVNTGAETTYAGNNGVQGFLNTGFILGADTDGYVNFSGDAYINWAFRRAPGFFDVVAYTGDSTSNRLINHNLQTAPQLIILKLRNAVGGWAVYTEATSAAGFLLLNATAAYQTGTYWGTSGGTTPTSSQFTVNGSGNVSTYNYITYLFATCPGVSKVGSYTGTGTTKQINCGFSGGARFVMIKRTDSTGDWYVWDTARGIVAGNDSYLTLNSTAAEVTTTDWVDPYSAGFELSSAAGNNVNINGASYIFLSVA